MKNDPDLKCICGHDAECHAPVGLSFDATPCQVEGCNCPDYWERDYYGDNATGRL